MSSSSEEDVESQMSAAGGAVMSQLMNQLQGMLTRQAMTPAVRVKDRNLKLNRLRLKCLKLGLQAPQQALREALQLRLLQRAPCKTMLQQRKLTTCSKQTLNTKSGMRTHPRSAVAVAASTSTMWTAGRRAPAMKTRRLSEKSFGFLTHHALKRISGTLDAVFTKASLS